MSAWSMGKGDKKGKGGKGKGGKKKGKGKKSREKNTEGTSFEVEQDDAGEAGHINGESGHGPWPEGLLTFGKFMSRLKADGS